MTGSRKEILIRDTIDYCSKDSSEILKLLANRNKNIPL